MKVEALSALVYASPNPEVLADFYRRYVGVPLEHASHGPITDHLEGWLGNVHVAIRKGPRPGPGPLAPTFRVTGLDALMGELDRGGVRRLHPPADLGGGKRLVTYEDPDGNLVRFIELNEQPA